MVRMVHFYYRSTPCQGLAFSVATLKTLWFSGKCSGCLVFMFVVNGSPLVMVLLGLPLLREPTHHSICTFCFGVCKSAKF